MLPGSGDGMKEIIFEVPNKIQTGGRLMKSKEVPQKRPKRIPIREDLFTAPLDNLEQVRMKGSRCQDCSEVFMGKVTTCANCSSTKLEDLILSNRGTLWTYTFIRYQPPGDYKGQVNPFIPFAEGLVELPEGIRVLAPVKECDFEKIRIGMSLDLVVHELFQDSDGNPVVAFYFRPASA